MGLQRWKEGVNKDVAEGVKDDKEWVNKNTRG
jgi:hypothetical protein